MHLTALAIAVLWAPVAGSTEDDPAIAMVRTRAFLTTTAPAVDLTIDGLSLANAVFTQLSGASSVRTVIDHNVVHVIRNTAGETLELQIDMVLARVPARRLIGWTLAHEASARTRLEIRNLNRGDSIIDTFEIDGLTRRFTTPSDLLRARGVVDRVAPVDSRLVLAFFYPWWDRAGWSNRSLFVDAPLRPYASDDEADLTRVMGEAKDAGLDALVVSWAGRDFDGGIDHRRMLTCLGAAQQAGIRIATLFETTVANPQHEDGLADPTTVFRWLADVVDSYASHPAYLRVDSRPAVLAYAAQRMSQAGWQDALSRLRASGRDVLMVGEGINATRLGALDGLFFYASNLYQGDDIRDFDRVQSLSVRTYHLLPNDSGHRRIWVATVSPGYDDRQLLDGREPRVTDREGGKYYARQWQSALEMQADWIVITSWNEWLENTQIEPSVRYGDLYTRLTKLGSLRFRRRQ